MVLTIFMYPYACTARYGSVQDVMMYKTLKYWRHLLQRDTLPSVKAPSTPTVSQGWCLKDGNVDQDDGQFVIEDSNIAENCLKSCSTYKNAKGCEWHSGGTCSVHTNTVVKGNGNAGYKCWVLPVKSMLPVKVNYFLIQPHAECTGYDRYVKTNGRQVPTKQLCASACVGESLVFAYGISPDEYGACYCEYEAKDWDCETKPSKHYNLYGIGSAFPGAGPPFMTTDSNDD